MKEITVKDILEITKGKLLYGNQNEVCENYSKDTKQINKGDIFVGIKGEKIDGSIFYKDALLNGAKGAIINKDANIKIEEMENKFIIEVEDTLKALQEIAKYKRTLYDIPVIAVTGSVGKTSTKDIIASVVEQKYKVLKTQGNYNNHLGVPLTILGLKDHTAMVVEMGMNHLGEIDVLTNIAKPTIAVITNVGTAHIGNLGSRENILKAKLEITNGLHKDGVLVINNDNDMLHKWQTSNKPKEYKVKTFGINNNSDLNAKDIVYKDTNSTYTLIDNQENNSKIDVPVGGESFIYNSLAAISVGKILGIELDKIKEGISSFQLTKSRLEIVKSDKGYTIINDCYNANYDSMKSAVEYLNNMTGQRKIAVLGDMLELGEYSKDLHEKVGKVVKENNIDILITVGELSKNIAKIVKENNKTKIYEYNSNDEAISKIKEIINKDDVILLKASNSMKFKDIFEAIK